jgi:hypothetical protein
MRFLSQVAVLLVGLATAASHQAAGFANPCDEPPAKEERERAKPPKKKRGLPNLTPEELRTWGPIRIEAVISCEGKVVGAEIHDQVPPELEKKIRDNLEGWRYRPASLDGEPIAVPFHLVLQEQRPRRQATLPNKRLQRTEGSARAFALSR